MPCEFIWDGYTEDGYIKALPGVYGEHRFKYRPSTVQERAPINDALKGRDSEYNRLIAELCAEKIQAWDIVDPRLKGNQVAKIDSANVLCLTPSLFNRLTDIVAGYAVSDKDPLKDKHDARTGIEKESEDAKNS